MSLARTPQIGLAAAIMLTTACASNPDKIDAAYVSPLKYQDYSCRQIAEEMDYVGSRTTDLYTRLKSERTKDNWQMGVGMVLFWPALFALEGGDGPEAAEYSRLKGEFEALRQTSNKKSCAIAKESPEEILKSKDEAEKAIAKGELEKYEPQYLEQVKGVANAMMCEEYVSFLQQEDGAEKWLLGCGDGESLKVRCDDGACFVEQTTEK